MRPLTLALAWIAAILFVLAGVMLTYEVLARYFFVRPTIWASELAQLCLIWGTMLAVAWLLPARRHIAVNALTNLLGPSGRRAAELAALVAVLAFAAVVTVYGFDIFYDSFRRGRMTGSMLNLPIWIAELAVPVGFALLVVQSGIEIVRVVRGGAPAVDDGALE